MSRWSTAEDLLIIALVHKVGNKSWKKLANVLNRRCKRSTPGFHRSGKECKERWINELDLRNRKGDWTDLEEKAFIMAHKLFGNKWTQISSFIPGRSETFLKNHFYSRVRTLMTKVKAMKFTNLCSPESRENLLYYLNYMLDALAFIDKFQRFQRTDPCQGNPKRLQDKYIVSRLMELEVYPSDLMEAIQFVSSINAPIALGKRNAPEEGRIHRVPKKFMKIDDGLRAPNAQGPVYNEARLLTELQALKVELEGLHVLNPASLLQQFQFLRAHSSLTPPMNADGIVDAYHRHLLCLCSRFSSSTGSRFPAQFVEHRVTSDLERLSPRQKLRLNSNKITQIEKDDKCTVNGFVEGSANLVSPRKRLLVSLEDCKPELQELKEASRVSITLDNGPRPTVCISGRPNKTQHMATKETRRSFTQLLFSARLSSSASFPSGSSLEKSRAANFVLEQGSNAKALSSLMQVQKHDGRSAVNGQASQQQTILHPASLQFLSNTISSCLDHLPMATSRKLFRLPAGSPKPGLTSEERECFIQFLQ